MVLTSISSGILVRDETQKNNPFSSHDEKIFFGCLLYANETKRNPSHAAETHTSTDDLSGGSGGCKMSVYPNSGHDLGRYMIIFGPYVDQDAQNQSKVARVTFPFDSVPAWMAGKRKISQKMAKKWLQNGQKLHFQGQIDFHTHRT